MSTAIVSAVSAASMEFEGKTVEQATELACKHFSLPADELDIEILSKGSSGIFGLGGRKAKIRVTPKRQAVKAHNALKSPDEPLVESSPSNAPSNAEPTSDLAYLNAVREMTEGLLKKMGLECNVELKNEKTGPKIEISGQDTAIVIGREGKTLEAIKYLVNRAAAKRLGGRDGAIS
ncbi:MAG: Jag N-terminal domain-containing protein, partial [Dissulfurimicrobium hydrothermale]